MLEKDKKVLLNCAKEWEIRDNWSKIRSKNVLCQLEPNTEANFGALELQFFGILGYLGMFLLQKVVQFEVKWIWHLFCRQILTAFGPILM